MTVAEGTVKGTGWPMDGHRLVFQQEDSGGELWRLLRWESSADSAVMQTMFGFESLAGICEHATLEAFAEEWDAGKWEPGMGFFIGREHLGSLRALCMEGMDESREGTNGNGRADGGIVTGGMHGAGGDTGCGPAGKDAVAKPGGFRAGPAAIGQEQLAEPAWMGAGAGNGTVQWDILLTGGRKET